MLALAAAPCFAAEGGLRAAVSVGRDGDGALLLSGADCGTLERQAAALGAWRTRLHEETGATGVCRCAGETCELRVASVAPDFVNRMHGVKAGRWGPNCWDTALVSDKILSAPSFTSPEEMAFWMKSPLCRAVGVREVPRPGDIIALRDQAGEEVHGFIYLTEELSFSKNYLTVAAPYALQSPDDVYAEFPVDKECRNPGSSAACAVRSDYFRCSTLQDYLATANLPADVDYPGAAAVVSEAERTISDIAMRWKTNPEIQNNAQAVLASKKEALLPVRDLSSRHSGLLWTALTLRIDSLLHQIDLI